jgi:hypothetical protein
VNQAFLAACPLFPYPRSLSSPCLGASPPRMLPKEEDDRWSARWPPHQTEEQAAKADIVSASAGKGPEPK